MTKAPEITKERLNLFYLRDMMEKVPERKIDIRCFDACVVGHMCRDPYFKAQGAHLSVQSSKELCGLTFMQNAWITYDEYYDDPRSKAEVLHHIDDVIEGRIPER